MSITNSRSLLKLMSIELVMPSSNRFIPCRPLLLLPSIFPSIRVFPNESVLHIRRPKSWGFSFSISPYCEYSGLISLGLCGGGLVAKSCPTLVTPQTSPPGSSVHGIFHARTLEWLPCPSPGGLPNPEIKPRSLALQVDSLRAEPPGKSYEGYSISY